MARQYTKTIVADFRSAQWAYNEGKAWRGILRSELMAKRACPFISSTPHHWYWWDGYRGRPFTFPREGGILANAGELT